MTYYLAIDIGASSGRHILCSIHEGKMQLEEIYRFKNHVILKDQHYCWDVDYLFQEILNGIKECVKQNKTPQTLGIDTWAVDYVLLDQEGQRIGDTYAYRDDRVNGYIDNNKIKDLYQQTGIQFQKFNTIYQLLSDSQERKQAVDYLMIPDYFNFLLTGKKVNEYTNMSTTQLLDKETYQLSQEIINHYGISQTMFQNIVMPSTSLGYLLLDIQDIVGARIEVVVPATHDTGSAYMAAVEEDSLIMSSGTWSLLGIETKQPIINEQAMKANFTNEGGFDYRFRFLKNIMGLWIIQEVSRELNGKYSFSELVYLARQHPFEGIFDVNDDRFLKPSSMIEEIQHYFIERNEQVPQSIGEITYCIYHSLAHAYKRAIDELEAITNCHYECINIIGGGCQNELLNEMIADICQKKVIAGPIEATALGNILAQLIHRGVVKDLTDGRKMIRESFEMKVYVGGE